MPIHPVAATHLFRPERDTLLRVLTRLDTDDWNRPTVCAGWNVHDVALHLLGGDIGMLSGGRDRFHDSSPAPASSSDLGDWETLVAWIDDRNARWIDGTRRMSPPLLCELMAFTGERVDAYLATIDLDAASIPVSWAGPDPAPTWLHVAREYTERWTHQQHIRDATGNPGFTEAQWLHPVLDTFARALPYTLRRHDAPDGSTVELRIDGPAGGSWCVQRQGEAWIFIAKDPDPPDTIVSMDEETAWRGFTRGISIERIRHNAHISGDRGIGEAIVHMVSIIA